MKINLLLGAILFFILSSLSVSGQKTETPSPSTTNPKAFALIQEAFRLESADLFESAIDKYKEVLKIEPKDLAAMNSIAGLYGKLGKF